MRRFPLGPVFAITPFNFPLNLVAHKVAPAIAAGCPLILKPAPQTPVTALMLAEVVHDAGWPEGALAVMPLSNDDAALLVADDRIKLLTFTGSAAVGWALKSKAGKKRVTLELGGNAAVIVHSDADLAYAAQRCVVGGFSYGGQTCISVQRILVERSVFDQLHQAAGRGRAQAQTRRSHARRHRHAPADSRAGRHPRHPMDRRSRAGRREAVVLAASARVPSSSQPC